MTIEIEWHDYDVVVVGSGGAGSHAAQAAAQAGARVLIVSKDPIGCSDTKISEGLATVRESGSDDDSEELLSENLRMAGGDLPVTALTDAFAQDSKDAYDRYRVQGLRPAIDTENNTPKSLPLPMGGHTRAGRSATAIAVSRSAMPTGTVSFRTAGSIISKIAGSSTSSRWKKIRRNAWSAG